MPRTKQSISCQEELLLPPVNSTPEKVNYSFIEEASEALLLLGGTTTDNENNKNPITPVGQGILRKTPKKPDAKRKLDLDGASSSSNKKTRIDSSLSALTKRFVTLIPEGGGCLDLNSAARSLQVQKRRIYDITNVLEGIGVLTKKSKNNIQWSDKLSGGGGELDVQRKKLEKEVSVLARREEEVDRFIGAIESGLKVMTDDKRWGYLTHSDIRSISHYKERTLLLIKAPPSTALTVPPRNEGLQMHMKSEGGEIGVYLCPDNEQENKLPNNSALHETLLPYGLQGPSNTPQNVQILSPREDNFELKGEEVGFSLLELESDENYNFALAPEEGLTSLFID